MVFPEGDTSRTSSWDLREITDGTSERSQLIENFASPCPSATSNSIRVALSTSALSVLQTPAFASAINMRRLCISQPGSWRRRPVHELPARFFREALESLLAARSDRDGVNGPAVLPETPLRVAELAVIMHAIGDQDGGATFGPSFPHQFAAARSNADSEVRRAVRPNAVDPV